MSASGSAPTSPSPTCSSRRSTGSRSISPTRTACSSAGRRVATASRARTSPSTSARSARCRCACVGDGLPSLLEVRGEVYLPISGFQALNERLQGTGAEAGPEPPQRCCRLAQAEESGHHRRPAARGVGVRRRRARRPRSRARRRRCSRGCASTASARTRTRSGSRRSPRSPLRASSGRAGAAELDYEIDGIVIKLDSFAQQERLGALHERPRWARAFKWAPSTAVTTLNKIHIRVGRTGALNPWAELEPVQVGGVTVSNATLHNEEDINRKEHPRGRPRDRAAGRRRDPAGRRAGRRRTGPARSTGRCRRTARSAASRSSSPRARSSTVARTAPARRVGSRRSSTGSARRWTSTASASSSSASSGTRDCCARCPTSTG